MKYDLYLRYVIKKDAIEKGKVIGITMVERSPYLSLKKNGVVYLEDAFGIDDTAYDDHLQLVNSNGNKFEKLSVTYTKQGTPNFILE